MDSRNPCPSHKSSLWLLARSGKDIRTAMDAGSSCPHYFCSRLAYSGGIGVEAYDVSDPDRRILRRAVSGRAAIPLVEKIEIPPPFFFQQTSDFC